MPCTTITQALKIVRFKMIKICITLKIHALLLMIISRVGSREFSKGEPFFLARTQPLLLHMNILNILVDALELSQILTTLKIEKHRFKMKEVNYVT